KRGSDAYRYGFNGKEKSDELDPNGSLMTAMFWEYDSRIGRRWNVDPKPTVSLSPYATFFNNPIRYSDANGDTVKFSARFLQTKQFKDGFELLMKSEAFRNMLSKYDIGGDKGVLKGAQNGEDATNTNIVFDVFDNPEKMGNTQMTVTTKDGKKVDAKYLTNAALFDKNSKVNINVFIDPSTHKSALGSSNTINHELSVHGITFMDLTSLLRDKSITTQEFLNYKKWGNDLWASKKNDLTSNGYYSPQIGHAMVAAGLNEYYNTIYKQVHGTLSPAQQKNYASDVGIGKDGYYSGDYKIATSGFGVTVEDMKKVELFKIKR
ncbi:MAG: hypothetical protein LH619_14260, partial [Chitinophagaceae bacterium]|nr:hypothetical protein [Chitinophagaceae bacterium]